MLKIFVIALFLPALLATPRIEATRGQFPFYIAILKHDLLYCGGALLTPTLGLTVASCEIDPVNDFTVLAGVVNLKKKDNGQQRDVAEFIPHKKFLTRGKGSDIAIVRVTSPFHFNKFVQAIPIATNEEVFALRTSDIGFGWTNSVTGRFNSFAIEFVKFSGCRQVRGGVNLPWGHIYCAMPADGVDRGPCTDGNGSPIVVKNEDTGEMALVGVASQAIDCVDAPHFPGIYTIVLVFNDWIEARKKKF